MGVASLLCLRVIPKSSDVIIPTQTEFIKISPLKEVAQNPSSSHYWTLLLCLSLPLIILPTSSEYFKDEVCVHSPTLVLLLGALNRFTASGISAQRQVDRLSGIHLCHRLEPDHITHQGRIEGQNFTSCPSRKLGGRCKPSPSLRWIEKTFKKK